MALIESYKETGDLNQLGELYDGYIHLVYGVCLKYLKDEDDSKDAVMQIFEKLVQSLKKHEVANFKSWLHVTAKNHCLMELRSRKTRPETNTKEVFMESDYVEHPEDDDTLERDIRNLEQGMANLPKEQQKCLELFFLEKNSYQQVAEITGYNLKKVKSYIQNGKRNLKLYLQKQG